MDIINELIAIIENSRQGSIDFNKIRFSKKQENVMNLVTDERVTIFNEFIGRMQGQSYVTLCKALQLSNQGHKNIIITAQEISYMSGKLNTILDTCNYKALISRRQKNGTEYLNVLKNGSTIKIVKLNEYTLRGGRCDYIICDDIDICDEHILSIVVNTTLHSPKGQVFLFPKEL